MEQQVVSVWAGTTGQLDDIPVGDIRKFESEFLAYLNHQHRGLLDAIIDSGKLADDTADGLRRAIDHFKLTFLTHDDRTVVKEPAVQPLPAGAEDRETITRYRETG